MNPRREASIFFVEDLILAACNFVALACVFVARNWNIRENGWDFLLFATVALPVAVRVTRERKTPEVDFILLGILSPRVVSRLDKRTKIILAAALLDDERDVESRGR